MSIDTWVAAGAAPAEPVADATPEPARAPATGAPIPPVALPQVPSARAVAEAHRDRLARRIVAADAVVALAASAAGFVVGYAAGESAPELAALVVGANLFWFLRLWRSRPVAMPLLRLGTPELRRVLVTAQLVYGPLVLIELLFPQMLPQALFLASAPVALVGALLVRLRFRHKATAVAPVPTLVVGGFASATASTRSLLGAEATGAQVVGVCLPTNDALVVDALDIAGTRVPVVGTDRSVLEAARETGAGIVVLTATDSLGPDDLRELMWQLAAEGIELVVTAGLPDVARSRMVSGSVGRTPMTAVAAPRPARSHGLGKRMLDLAVAGAGVLVTGPVMLAIAVAVKADSRGPVFYRAQRVGAGGESFDMIKFRSMYVDADTRRGVLADENMGAGPLFKVKNDPRVTRVGRFIRRYSLDELPQFFNVLGGSMSVVGPRPALAHEVEQYPPVMLRRMLVKPGVTGAWQVNGRSNLSWDESIRLDVGYVENWSLGTDVGIIARTVRTVLTSDGAYGSTYRRRRAGDLLGSTGARRCAAAHRPSHPCVRRDRWCPRRRLHGEPLGRTRVAGPRARLPVRGNRGPLLGDRRAVRAARRPRRPMVRLPRLRRARRVRLGRRLRVGVPARDAAVRGRPVPVRRAARLGPGHRGRLRARAAGAAMTTVIVAVGGAVGSVLGYRLVARGPRWTTMLCVTALVSVLLGGVARLVRIVGDTGLAAVPVALLGPIVTFTGIGWWLVASPRGDWRRAVLVVGGGVAAAILGYLSIDLMGLAYIKFPRFG